MKERPKKIWRTASKLTIFTAVFFLIFVLVFLGMEDNVDVQKTRNENDFVRIENYTKEERTDADSPSGYTQEYRFTIEKSVTNDTYLAFYTVHQYIRVYLDEECVYALQPSKTLLRISTPGGSWVMIPLYQKDAGKNVRIVVSPVYDSVRNRNIKLLMGSKFAIFEDCLKTDLPLLLVSGLTMLAGIVFTGIGLYDRLINKKEGELFAFGIFAVLLGVWRFADTRFSPFMLPDRPVFLFYVSIAAMMIGMIPLILSQKKNLPGDSAYIYSAVAAALCIGQILIQFLGICDLWETLYITYGVIFAGVAIMTVTQIYKWKKDPQLFRTDYRKFVWWILIAGMAADAVSYYVKGNTTGMIFFMLAFLIYVVIHIGMFGYEYQKQQVMLVEKEQQIMNTRISAMMSQIRSHFVFNILNAISGMCKYNPEKADQTVVCFARYLRKNIDIIQEDRPITFQQALAQLEDYIALEKIRYGDRLRYVKDIRAEDFMLPSLILQPIVENALEHGLKEKPSGGTIILRTWEADDEIRILVEDDGIGFDADSQQDKRSVGLQNVSFRLQHMMHGRMTISSSPQEGTVVTIIIPRKEAQGCM